MTYRTPDESSNYEDLQLVIRAREGDEIAFTQLFNKHQSWVYAKIYTKLNHYQDTQDAVQDVFIKVWNNLEKWDPALGYFEAWLTTLTQRIIIDMLRKRKRLRDAPLNNHSQDEEVLSRHVDPRPQPDQYLEKREAQKLLENALVRIKNPKHRIAWILRHLEGYSINQISYILNQKNGTIKVWIYRGNSELRQILTEQGYGGG